PVVELTVGDAGCLGRDRAAVTRRRVELGEAVGEQQGLGRVPRRVAPGHFRHVESLTFRLNLRFKLCRAPHATPTVTTRQSHPGVSRTDFAGCDSQPVERTPDEARPDDLELPR